MTRSNHTAESATTPKVNRDTKATHPGDQRLEKVQELLFGPRSRELEGATAQLALRIEQSLAAMKKDAEEWRTTLMTHLTNEVAELKKQIRQEQQARTKALKASLEQLERVQTALEERIAQLDAAAKQGDEETRTNLDAAAAELRTEIQRSRAELQSSTEQVSRDLDHEKADRAKLSGLFLHVAEQLQNGDGTSA